jgi:membrane protease YdiL (CAAX protease family)
MLSLFRSKIRPIILTVIAPIAGFTFLYLLEVFLNVEFSKQLSAMVNFVIAALIVFLIFPRRLGIPFGKIETREFLRKTGFYLPENAWKQVILGLVLAGCNLSGMLFASIYTDKYVVDLTRINIPHLMFSLNPALWEELFFRGVLMILLLKNDIPLKRAFLIQLALFGVMHFKGTSLLAFVDIFSVMVIATGFTYVAYKTRSLLAGIVFHYFYDVFVIFVQIPGGFAQASMAENAIFYGSLWSMVGIGCIITKYFVEKLGVQATEELYERTARAHVSTSLSV